RLERVAGFVDLAVGIEDGRVDLGTPTEILDALEIGPPVSRLGRRLGWTFMPLTVRDARRRASELHLAEPRPTHPVDAEPGALLLEAKGVYASYDEHKVL